MQTQTAIILFSVRKFIARVSRKFVDLIQNLSSLSISYYSDT